MMQIKILFWNGRPHTHGNPAPWPVVFVAMPLFFNDATARSEEARNRSKRLLLHRRLCSPADEINHAYAVWKNNERAKKFSSELPAARPKSCFSLPDCSAFNSATARNKNRKRKPKHQIGINQSRSRIKRDTIQFGVWLCVWFSFGRRNEPYEKAGRGARDVCAPATWWTVIVRLVTSEPKRHATMAAAFSHCDHRDHSASPNCGGRRARIKTERRIFHTILGRMVFLA